MEKPKDKTWHQLPHEEVVGGLGVNPATGLAVDEVRRRVAGLARGRVARAGPGSGNVRVAMGAQRAVDAAVFRTASSGTRVDRYHRAVAGAGGDAGGFLARAAGGGRFAAAVSGVGDVCDRAELHHLAAESVRQAHDLEVFQRAGLD